MGYIVRLRLDERVLAQSDMRGAKLRQGGPVMSFVEIS